MTKPDSSQLAAFSQDNQLDDGALGASIIRVLVDSGNASLSAPEIAQAIRPQGDWHALLTPIRRAAVTGAIEGRLIIYRKGKPVDPQNFSGVYRIGLPRQD